MSDNVIVRGGPIIGGRRTTTDECCSAPKFGELYTIVPKYHVLLCSDAGYLCIRKGDHNHMPTDIIRLTWCGHKAMETMRAEGVGKDPG